MEDLKTFALKQVRNEIKFLETEIIKDTHLLEKVKQNHAIGFPRTAIDIEREIKNIEHQIQYLLIQKGEMERER